MALASNGGTVTVTAAAVNLVQALINAGIAVPPFKSPYDKSALPHVGYRSLSLHPDAGNTAAVVLGHTSAVLTTGPNRALVLVKTDPTWVETLTPGEGSLENWWVIGTANDLLYVHWTE